MFLVMFRSFGLSGLSSGLYYILFFRTTVARSFLTSRLSTGWSIIHSIPCWNGDQLLLLRGAGRHDSSLLGDGQNRPSWPAGHLCRVGPLRVSVLVHRFRGGASRSPLRRPCFFYGTYSLANLSLFSNLLSGGLGLLTLVSYALQAVGRSRPERPFQKLARPLAWSRARREAPRAHDSVR